MNSARMRRSSLFETEKIDEAQYFAKASSHQPVFLTELGALYAADCMKVLPELRDAIADCLFADPPFNLGKEYGKNTNDQIADEEYLAWCRRWIDQCIRLLKPGGSFFSIICRSGISFWARTFRLRGWTFVTGLPSKSAQAFR
jgi:DNA modification methylase